MKTTSHLALSSALNVRNVNVRTQKGRYTMRSINLGLVVLTATSLLTLAGCGMDDNSEEPLGVSLTVTAKAKECAAEAGAPDCSKIEFCVQHVVNPAEAVNPTATGTCVPMNLTSGEATGTFASLPEPGSFIVGFKFLPEGFHVKYTMGGFETDDVIELNQGTNSLNVVLGTDGNVTPNSGPGNVTIDAIKDNGDAVTNCAWNFNSDQLDAVCVVKPEGVSCNNIAAGNYTVDVSCDDKKLIKTGYAFEVIPTVTTAYTVIVTTAGSTGSGFGALCVKLTDENGNPIDETACESYKVNGVAVNPVFDDPDCQDALLDGLPKGTSTVEVTCDGDKGSLVTEVTEDKTSDVTIKVESPVVNPTNGSACITTLNSVGEPVDNCALTFVQMVTQPTTSSDPSCTGVGKSYYVGLPASTYTVAAVCANASGSAAVHVVAGQHVAQDIYTYGAVPDGDLCSVDHAFIVDMYATRLDLESQLGYGNNGGCNPAAVSDWTKISVISLSGPDCTSITDVNCRVKVVGLASDPLINGVHAHMLWDATMTGMDDKELLIFSMGIEDSGTQQSITRNLWVYNGDAVDL